MTEDEIILFLEENGFVMEKSLGFPFVKTVIQSGENILFMAKISDGFFKLVSSITWLEKNICYSSELKDNLSKLSEMDKIMNVFTALPILMKTFYKTEENTAILINTHKGQSYHEFYPIKYSGYGTDRVVRHSYNSYMMPPIRIFYTEGFFKLTRRKYLESSCIVSVSESIYIDDLFDGKYKDKSLDVIEWKVR